jgi:hypothetical protein
MASSSRRPKTSDFVIAIAIASLGAAALVAPDLVLRLTPPCLISTLLGEVCWGCGITHAALAFLHADFAGAWAFNKMSVLVLPLLLWQYVLYLRMIWRACVPRRPRPT